MVLGSGLVIVPAGRLVFKRTKSPPDNNRKNGLPEETALEEAIEITEAFGAFLGKGAPVIADAKLLPYPKLQTKRALAVYEKHICDLANIYIELAEVWTHLKTKRVVTSR